MGKKPLKLNKKQQESLKKKLAPVYRNIGALTFGVGLVAILIGLWIDRSKGTTPIFTLVVLVVSVPLVLFLNTRMLRKAIEKAAVETKNEPRN